MWIGIQKRGYNGAAEGPKYWAEWNPSPGKVRKQEADRRLAIRNLRAKHGMGMNDPIYTYFTEERPEGVEVPL